MSSGHHIPFPRNFLSLNTPTKKTPDGTVLSASPDAEFAAHGFLSNRPTAVPRHSSVSSVGSVDNATSPASSPPASEPTASPILCRALPAFLALNTKHAAPPASLKEMSDDKTGFLSNRH